MKKFALLCGLAALTACSTMPKTVEKPDVAVQSLDLKKASLTDATVLLKLDVRNPNPFDLKVDSMKYGLTINGKSFAAGDTNQAVSVPANSEGEVTIPLRMKYWDLFSQFSDLMKNKSNSYQITGALKSYGKVFPFEHQGEVKLPS